MFLKYFDIMLLRDWYWYYYCL